MDLPEFIDKDLWDNFIEYRREIDKPLTPRAHDMNIRRLISFYEEGYCPNKILIAAMAEGWRGLYTADDCKRTKRRTQDTTKPAELYVVDKDKGRAALQAARRAVK